MNPNILTVEYSEKRQSFRVITAKCMIDINIRKIMHQNIDTDFIPIGFFFSKEKAHLFIQEFIDAMSIKKDPIVEFNEIISKCKK